MNALGCDAGDMSAMSEFAREADTLAPAIEQGECSRARFAELVDEYQDRLRGFLFRYTGNVADAEDLAQDTFVKAYRNYHRYDSRYAFSTWLFTIARRTAYNHFRDRKPTETLDFDLAAGGEGPAAEACREDERSWVWQAARNLKPEFREALLLKYADDLSIEEIAKIMGKSQTNIKIILFRARNQLKRQLESEKKEYRA